MTDHVTMLEEAIDYVQNKNGVMEADDYLRYDDSLKRVTEAAKRDLSRMKSLPEDRKRALDDMPVALNNVLRYEEHNEAVAEWHYKNYSVIRSCLSDAGWRKIETAPRDGTRFLGYNKDLCWINDRGESMGMPYQLCWYGASVKTGKPRILVHMLGDFVSEDTGPTHWMPLPAPPATDALGKV